MTENLGISRVVRRRPQPASQRPTEASCARPWKCNNIPPVLPFVSSVHSITCPKKKEEFAKKTACFSRFICHAMRESW